MWRRAPRDARASDGNHTPAARESPARTGCSASSPTAGTTAGDAPLFCASAHRGVPSGPEDAPTRTRRQAPLARPWRGATTHRGGPLCARLPFLRAPPCSAVPILLRTPRSVPLGACAPPCRTCRGTPRARDARGTGRTPTRAPRGPLRFHACGQPRAPHAQRGCSCRVWAQRRCRCGSGLRAGRGPGQGPGTRDALRTSGDSRVQRFPDHCGGPQGRVAVFVR